MGLAALSGGRRRERDGDASFLVFRIFPSFYDESVLKTLEYSFHFWTSSFSLGLFDDEITLKTLASKFLLLLI